MASGGEDIDGNSPGNDLQILANIRGPVASTFYGHARGSLTNLNSFTFDFTGAQSASYPLTDSSFQTPLSHNGSTGLYSNFWNPGQSISSLQNETELSLMNAGQPLLLDTTVSTSEGSSQYEFSLANCNKVSPSFNDSDYTSFSVPERNRFLTVSSVYCLLNVLGSG
jgi:hypothetical protein